MNGTTEDRCPMCGAERRTGETTFSVELGHGVVVVRHVPATVCVQCGSDWISDDVAAKLEQYVDEAREKHSLVEVVGFP
jgi:YgiT-type zinc finger domain-containing protein